MVLDGCRSLPFEFVEGSPSLLVALGATAAAVDVSSDTELTKKVTVAE
ncbi:hypothetical protein [Sporisorium scitamineum]|uniref:Uncharacterized protein n=1 Tax=Sporisorium scitamineum TaxID=49012 RepID=A0A0F7S413_9BASI|nr:hypothetical protein [Sporisorium scitamineum]